MTAWKDLERRVCVALGGRRAGPLGAAVSDCVNVPYSVECKRSNRVGPPVLAKWILQAKAQGRAEAKPWLLVVAGHNDRAPIVVMDFRTLLALQSAADGQRTATAQEAK